MGYALLKAKSSKILKQDGFAAEDETAEGICSLYVYSNIMELVFVRRDWIRSVLIPFFMPCSLKLKDFHKFDSAATALEQTAALVEGKVTPRLSSLLDSIKDEKKVSLAVADPKLGTIRTGYQDHELLVDPVHSQCHQQAAPALPQSHI